MGTDQSIVRRVEPERSAAAALAPPVSPIVARMSINIRPATMEDLEFIDSMQKAHSRELGFLPTSALEGKIARNEVLVAEALPISDFQLPNEQASPSEIGNRQSAIGYLIAADRYFKRDEIGYITQINVLKGFRRSLVAASLLQAQFDRSAYGCRLYCCWCAQDLVSANEFWAAMGFVPIAFRTGSRSRGQSRGQKSEVRDQKGRGSRAAGGARIHIFWQKRVRADDVATPWWYPSQTSGGAMREDRLVFPIPPGVSWRDVLPVVLPGTQRPAKRPRAKKVLKSPRLKGSLWFAHEAIVERVEIVKSEAKAKIDPRLTAMARELRDRWTERAAMILPPPAKHDVRRMISASTSDAATERDRAVAPATIAALPQATLPQAA